MQKPRSGHGRGKANPAYTHGMRTREWQEMRKAINDLLRMEKEIEELISG